MQNLTTKPITLPTRQTTGCQFCGGTGTIERQVDGVVKRIACSCQTKETSIMTK